jgi:hypothetical protein
MTCHILCESDRVAALGKINQRIEFLSLGAASGRPEAAALARQAHSFAANGAANASNTARENATFAFNSAFSGLLRTLH